MGPTRAAPNSPESGAALAALDPERFGFRHYRDGWVKEFAGLGAVAFAALGWPHAHAPAYDLVAGDRVPTDALGLLVELQRRTWGMPPEDLVPANVLAIAADTGGAVLVAYRLAVGFNADGWLGFVIGIGSRSGILVSHMLGVREDARGGHDLGWHLKLIQGYQALRTGHLAAAWTFDPLRGANARLNLEKLAAVVEELTIDKYGALRSTLYGEVPSDRLTARWDLLSPATAARLAAVAAGCYRGLAPADLAGVPTVTPRSLPTLMNAGAPRLRYQIPGDIDRLMHHDPRRAIAWRQEMRQVLSALLTTNSARLPAPAVGHGAGKSPSPEVGGGVGEGASSPIAFATQTRPGAYAITGFATSPDAAGERESWYVLERKPG